MKYLPQNQIAGFRDKHKPKRCPILDKETDDWVLDHDHQTGLVRGVISRQANSLLGKVENFFLKRCAGIKEELPCVLRRMADYLDKPPMHKPPMSYMHPVGLTQKCKRFFRLTKDEQFLVLRAKGCSKAEIAECNNTTERTKLYRKVIKDGTR
jgi:hypothetical protein